MINKDWRVSVSVGIVLLNNSYGKGVSKKSSIVMVRKRESGLLAIPAGHMDPNETSIQTAYRELFEETGINADEVKLIGSPEIREMPGEEKTKIGIIYKGYLNNPLPDKGFPVESEEIDWVRPVYMDELLRIKNGKGKGLFKPEYNLLTIIKFLDGVYCDL